MPDLLFQRKRHLCALLLFSHFVLLFRFVSIFLKEKNMIERNIVIRVKTDQTTCRLQFFKRKISRFYFLFFGSKYEDFT